MRWLVSLPLVALLASPPVAACPVMTMAYRPLATKNVTMLPDGGVLLGASKSFGQKKNGAFSLVDDTGSAIESTEDPIAPGLIRIAPKLHADREVSFLEDGKPLFALQDAAGAPALAAIPKIAKVTSTLSRTTRVRNPTQAWVTTMITLASPPPSNVVGIVLYGSDFLAHAWLRTNGGRTYELTLGGKGCDDVGMSGTYVGDDVMFAFVDAAGRVSAKSKPARVRRPPPPPPPPKKIKPL
jgi:hypothetical protein